MELFGVQAHEPKRFRHGTERSRSPAETLAAFAEARHAVGITRLANVTGLDRVGIPVFMAVRPNARSLSVSQGKGLDVDAARASAMMEAIELWHAERIVLPLRHDSYRALQLEGAVVDLEHVPLRPRATLRHDVAYEWIAGEDLLTAAPTWVPFESVSMNTVIASDRYRTFAGGTNGLASGNHLLEATVHAVLELIERDAVTLFHLQPEAARIGRRIAPDSIVEPACAALLAKLASAELETALWEVTSDLGVPAFLAAIADPDDRAAGIYRGYGAHLNATIALGRAITEAAQSRLTMIAGSRDDNLPGVYVAARYADQVAEQHRYYFAAPASSPFAEFDLGTASFELDLEVLLARLRAAGIEQVVAVPLTQQAIGVPVVKVMAAGLEPYLFAADYRPGARARKISG